MAKVKVLLPVHPSHPFIDPDYSLPPGYLSQPGADAEARLWGVDEVRAIAEDFARKHRGTVEAVSALGWAKSANLPFQVQTTARVFELNEQQALSLSCGGTWARTYGAGLHRWRSAMHAEVGSFPLKVTAITGGAFSNDNIDSQTGEVWFRGVEVEDVYDLMFNSLCSDIRAGAYIIAAQPG